MRLLNVAGARPNFMKIAPLMQAYAEAPDIEARLVHTGQHYDANMSDLFFRQLGIPEPQINLGVGSGSHAVQTAEIMRAFEPILEQHRPDAVLVVGDVNSTIACGLVAVKLGVRLGLLDAFGLAVVGNPEQCRRKIRKYAAAGVTHLLCAFGAGAVEHGVVEESLELFASEVIPAYSGPVNATGQHQAALP